MKISVVVNTYNSALYLRKCLESAKRFDEIVLCDMHSNDETLEIAQEFGCKVFMHEHVGFVEPARNFAISKASNEWVLVLDSDEVVPEGLVDYLYKFAEEDHFCGLKIPVLEYFMGHSLRSSYPNHVIRFMKRDKVFWPETIHSKPVIDGSISEISAKCKDLALKHYSNPSISWRLDKINLYTSKEVERKKSKAKYSSFLMTTISAIVKFIKSYIIKGGFLDGKAGFAYAVLECYYKYVVLFKIWEAKRCNCEGKK